LQRRAFLDEAGKMTVAGDEALLRSWQRP
jgi:hypothetical protein